MKKSLNPQLINACKAGQTAQIISLLKQGADVHIRSTADANKTPLHLVMEKGSLEAVIAILDAGADLEAKDGWGNNALYCAAFYGKKDIVAELLNRGAVKFYRPQGQGHNPSEVARKRGYHEIALLIEQYEKPLAKPIDTKIQGIPSMSFTNAQQKTFNNFLSQAFLEIKNNDWVKAKNAFEAANQLLRMHYNEILFYGAILSILR